MAFKPMSPQERASIEAQVLLKAGTELAIAEIANGEGGVAVTMAVENAKALAAALPALKASLVEGVVQEATETAVSTLKEAFPEAVAVQAAAPRTYAKGQSMYIDDDEYTLVQRLFMAERSNGIAYASKDSFFMDNQAVRKMFAAGSRQFPADYWAEAMRGRDIPVTKNGKCGLGDFKIKKGVSLDEAGVPFLAQGEGNHPVANKSGYYGGLVNNTTFNWGDRPEPIDPQGWLNQVNA
jgi:hypothetical protein